MTRRLSPLADAIGVYVGRFVLMWVTLLLAPWVGATGWWLGFTANVVLVIAAAALVTHRGLWSASGITRPWLGGAAALALVPLVLEAISWLVPGGLLAQQPGFAWWALTMLLVGINEELFARVVVLERLREAYRPELAVLISAVLFGLQHLSALALTSRGFGDVAGNVVLSSIEGFVLGAFQLRFHWLWPLILVHAASDWTTTLAVRPLPDLAIGCWQLVFIALGLVLLRGVTRPAPTQLLRC